MVGFEGPARFRLNSGATPLTTVVGSTRQSTEGPPPASGADARTDPRVRGRRHGSRMTGWQNLCLPQRAGARCQRFAFQMSCAGSTQCCPAWRARLDHQGRRPAPSLSCAGLVLGLSTRGSTRASTAQTGHRPTAGSPGQAPAMTIWWSGRRVRQRPIIVASEPDSIGLDPSIQWTRGCQG